MNRYKIHEDRTVDSDYVTARCKRLLQNHLFYCCEKQAMHTIFMFLSQRGIPFNLQYKSTAKIYKMTISIHTGGNNRTTFEGQNKEPHVACSLALMLAAEFTGA